MATDYQLSATHRVTIEIPEVLVDYLNAHKGSKEERSYEWQMSAARNSNVAAGSNEYSGMQEWADFTSEADAKKAGTLLCRVVAVWVITANAWKARQDADRARENGNG